MVARCEKVTFYSFLIDLNVCIKQNEATLWIKAFICALGTANARALHLGVHNPNTPGARFSFSRTPGSESWRGTALEHHSPAGKIFHL